MLDESIVNRMKKMLEQGEPVKRIARVLQQPGSRRWTGLKAGSGSKTARPIVRHPASGAPHKKSPVS